MRVTPSCLTTIVRVCGSVKASFHKRPHAALWLG